jgi:hypothetical protein
MLLDFNAKSKLKSPLFSIVILRYLHSLMKMFPKVIYSFSDFEIALGFSSR